MSLIFKSQLLRTPQPVDTLAAFILKGAGGLCQDFLEINFLVVSDREE